ncbi:protein gamete expressed 1 [Phtheirospermum japonicum]|uniref:Protein gamete expressed 1 n=1 Tax=Phtheirospermum japonicum TaxID=374723 RepID=A0A830BAY8_9LAMI|nr:protein gamete expressed 1 [Phtheirospermum japonicum]
MSFFLFSILILLSQTHSSQSWFFSAKQESHDSNNNNMMPKFVISEFSMEALHDDQRGVQLVENARSKMLAPNSCWQAAYQNVFEGCAKTLADDELKSRLSWHLSDCFQRHTGRPSFPHCDPKSNMEKCLKNLDRDAHKVYLEYFLETNSICHQLQTDAFRRQTERLVNELKSTAEYAEIKLGKIEWQGDLLLQSSKQVHDSLSSIDLKTQQVAETSRIVEDHVSSVLKHSEQVYEQSKGIAASQVELRDGQARMKENLEQGLGLIQDSYESLGVEIVNLRNEAVEIEKEIGKVGDAMVSKMSVLQSKADDIGEIAGTSLDKQKQLLDGQSVALEGLHFLTKFQSQALEESRTDAFRRQTERLVNELKSTAEYAEIKLGKIEWQGDLLLQSSKQVHDSLSSIDLKTQQVAETSRIVEDHVSSVLKHSEQVYEQSKGIAASQVELRDGQARMKENLEQGLGLIQDSYESLGVEIVNLRNEAVEIEKEIGKVGDAMVSKMSVLQSKADDIGEIAGTSLDKQKQLLDGQSVALEGLHFLTKFQSQALEESRVTLEKLAEYGHKQQEELLEKQKQLHQSHDHLVENSKLIIAAQEAFESKQASMFHAIDKLFDLHSAMLFESRVIITFFVYSIAIFIIYMLTSIKHAYNVRHRLYLGLCATFLIEVIILWYITTDAEQQGRIIRMTRSLFWFLASAQYLHAIFTYRDYEMLNHTMLMTLMEKVNGMHGNNKELLTWDVDDGDSEVNWSSWVDDELPEEVDLLEDPDFLLPKEVEDDDDDDSSVTSSSTKRYNLRRRR